MRELIERLRVLEQDHEPDGWPAVRMRDITALLDALDADQEHACVKLVADIRFACGDNGKRMQPELVEFIRELAADAERYRWLRDIPSQLRADHDHNPAAGGWDAPIFWHGLSKPGDELQGRDLDTAIDKAREGDRP